MSDDTKTNKNANARRAILKSMAAGGGAIAAGKMVPEKWAEPIVESVVLPAHAQTSTSTTQVSSLAALSGLYGGPATFSSLTLPAASPVLLADEKNSSNGLIEMLIPSSYASHQSHAYEACGISDDVAASTVAIYVNQETGLVNICIEAPYKSDTTIVSATSTLTTTGIADVIGIDFSQSFSDDDDDQGDDDTAFNDLVDLTDMVENEDNSITGTIRIYSPDDDTDDAYGGVNCSTSFTAEFTGGSFSCEEINPRDDDD